VGDGERDAEEPDGRRPLPPEDRVWRHPAEVALDARRAIARRRARRVRTGITVIGGALAVSGLVWVSRADPDAGNSDRVLLASASEPADVVGSTTSDLPGSAIEPTPPTTTAHSTTGPTDPGLLPPEPTTTGPASTRPTTTVHTTTTVRAAPDDPRLVRFEEPADDPIVVRSTAGDVLAGGLMVRDGYLITSDAALNGDDDVLVTWGESSEPGTVVGRDGVTDVAVIRVDGSAPLPTHGDARVHEGDEVNLSTTDGGRSIRRVVAEQSTSAMTNGEPVVGIVELDERIGDVAPGTPAYDHNGNIVGITTATADRAPAAIVPIELAREVADEIIATGGATHPWLGITARNPDVAGGDQPGSLVTAVRADGPAAGCGMVADDLITGIDDRTIDSMAAMVATLRSYEPGETVDITIWRDGREVECDVELASHVEVAA
jgi:putative serine protease PepD